MKESFIENRQIRVFISSTFRDMRDERDYLMKRTFPKLRQKAMARDVTLTELDLRWGITEEESKTGKVVDICFREIENSVPFFIGIVGNRYGWVPKKEELGANITSRFPAVDTYLENHLSVTEMEMQFGVLQRQEDMHAFFYFKEQEEEQDNPLMLRRLKKAILESPYPSSSYSSVEDLSKQVEEAFTKLLDELFPAGNLSGHQKEKLIQKSFISRLSATYVRDENNFKKLDGFAQSVDSQFLVVTGESGLGKSSLLANWVKERWDSDTFTVIPFFSSNGGNQMHVHILKYLVEEICEKYEIEIPVGTETEQLEKVFDLFALRKDQLIIIFDAINQIADIDQSKMLNWLPIPPNNVKFLFSTLPEDTTMQVFNNKSYPVFWLQRLSRSQRIELVENYLHSFGKKLDTKQINKIVDDNQCENTLVLKTLLDELISYGDYDTLDKKIDYYLHGKSVAEFYERVIIRFEDDYGRDFVKRILGLIATSRNGVSEEEIIHMTGTTRYQWSDFFCSFSTHLNNQSGRYVFTHSYITSTVWKRYLEGNIKFEEECRRNLAEEMCENASTNAMQEVPYQYDRLKEWEKLHDYITTASYLLFCMDFDEVEIGTYWRHINEAFPGKYSIKEYLDCKDCKDIITLCEKVMRLCTVLYLPKIKKEIAQKLISIIDENPELATPKVYLTIADGLERPESIEYANKSLELYKEQKDILGEIEALRILGGNYYDAAVKENDDKYGEMAYQVWDEAKDLSIELYGEVHPLVMHAYKDMGIMAKDLNKGLELTLKAVDLGIALFGKDHPLVGRPYHYVGCIYREMAKWKEALFYFQEACRVWLPAYGVNHEIMNSSYGNQGKALMNLGRLEEALRCYDKCLDIQSVIFDERGYDYAVCQMNRARILAALGRKEEALDTCDAVESTLLIDKVKAEGRSIPLLKSVREFRKSIQ